MGNFSIKTPAGYPCGNSAVVAWQNTSYKVREEGQIFTSTDVNNVINDCLSKYIDGTLYGILDDIQQKCTDIKNALSDLKVGDVDITRPLDSFSKTANSIQSQLKSLRSSIITFANNAPVKDRNAYSTWKKSAEYQKLQEAKSGGSTT